MSEEFKVKPHSELAGKEMVEYWRDGVFIAGIYPHLDGIRVVSKFMVGLRPEVGWPPAVILEIGKAGDTLSVGG
jgi:hypothetical protein